MKSTKLRNGFEYLTKDIPNHPAVWVVGLVWLSHVVALAVLIVLTVLSLLG